MSGDAYMRMRADRAEGLARRRWEPADGDLEAIVSRVRADEVAKVYLEREQWREHQEAIMESRSKTSSRRWGKR